MIPGHCREVGVKKVHFPLTEANIAGDSSGRSVYTATNYLALNNGRDWALVKIKKARKPGLFRKIENIEIVSMPDDTAYVEKAAVDVQNPSVMVTLAENLGVETLVVKGKFEHISFVHKERSLPLVVYDVVPPSPSKIVALAEAALDTGRIRKPIRIVPIITDLNEVARKRQTKHVMFPCYATSLVSGGEGNEGALYLDQAPDLGVAASEITLIGCEVSNRIFTSVYGVKPAEFIDMCPKNMIRGTSQPCLSRCCMIDEGHRIEGSAAYVSWGASVGEVEEAIIDLFRLDVEEAPSLDEFDALGNRVANLTS